MKRTDGLLLALYGLLWAYSVASVGLLAAAGDAWSAVSAAMAATGFTVAFMARLSRSLLGAA